mmetsp:Transcript_6231/g.14189  ORF Transcript_6231/g.14189 Transcript_6231/m.14189 type:complete len:356 (-) Transcript_6231:199-1266(-)
MLITSSLETIAVVVSWFVLNIAMGSSTKWIYLWGQICIEGRGCQTYKFPLAITVIHMIFSWVMCHVHIYYLRGSKAELTFYQQFKTVAPLSVCFALSVAMGNLSLKYIYPSFNQMLGSMSPLITVVLAVLLQRKRYNAWTWVSMPVICGGLAVCSTQEVNFNLLGAFYATGATVLRALKSIMQGRLLNSAEKSLDSVTLLYYMAPWAAGLLMLMALFSEGLDPIVLLLSGLYQPGVVVTGRGHVFALLFISGLNACLLNVANFLVTSYTSAVTLQVLGNVKSCLAIAVSVAIFRNHLAIEQAVGVAACLVGVWLYQKKGGPARKLTKVSEDPSPIAKEEPGTPSIKAAKEKNTAK